LDKGDPADPGLMKYPVAHGLFSNKSKFGIRQAAIEAAIAPVVI